MAPRPTFELSHTKRMRSRMATLNAKNSYRQRYFTAVLRIAVDDIAPLTDFLSRNRKEESFKFFSCVKDQMEIFEEAASRKGGVCPSGNRRDIHLHRLPQFDDVVSFLIGNKRRLEVRALVKERRSS